EREAARLPGLAIGHDLDLDDLAPVLLECIPQSLIARAERKIAHVEPCSDRHEGFTSKWRPYLSCAGATTLLSENWCPGLPRLPHRSVAFATYLRMRPQVPSATSPRHVNSPSKLGDDARSACMTLRVMSCPPFVQAGSGQGISKRAGARSTTIRQRYWFPPFITSI